MKGEIVGYKRGVEEEEEINTEENQTEMVGGGLVQSKKTIVVGYALTSKKTKSFLQPKLECLAR